MDNNTTIGKCCYCGQRVILAKGQRLNCESCGAPIHKLEVANFANPAPIPKPAAQLRQFPEKIPAPKPAPQRKRRDDDDDESWGSSIFKRVIDLADDIFD